MKNYTDQALMNLVLQKHPDALEEIYNRYSKLVYSCAYQAVQNEQAAKEIVQLVFLRLWTTKKGFHTIQGKFINWIFTITRHITIDYIRKEDQYRHEIKVEPEKWNRLPDNSADLIEDWLAQHSIREHMQQAYGFLSARQKHLIESLYWHGYTLKEMARIYNEPVGTVKSRLHQSLKILRKHLVERKEPTDETQSL